MNLEKCANRLGWTCMEIKRTNWTNNCVKTEHKETQWTTQTKMGRQNKGDLKIL